MGVVLKSEGPITLSHWLPLRMVDSAITSDVPRRISSGDAQDKSILAALSKT